MANPICVGGTLDRSSNLKKYIFVDLWDFIDSGGNLPEKRLELSGITWRAFSLLGISLILTWK